MPPAPDSPEDARGNARRPPLVHVILSTGFGSGLAPFAPGTFGSLTATLLWLGAFAFFPEKILAITLAAIVIATVVGVYSSGVMEKYWGKDPGAVVIDEFVGVWIPLTVAPSGARTWVWALVAFVLFRIFDISKPFGCRRIEQTFPRGWGIMFDDVLAGIYALCVIACVKFLAFPLFAG